MTKRFLLLLAVLLLTGGLALGTHLWAAHHHRAGREALDRRDFAAAQDHFAACARVWFRDPETRLLLARSARQAGDHETAQAALRACRDLGVPDETVVVEGLLVHVRQGNLAAVESALQNRVRRRHPDSVLILEALVPAYLKTYRLDHAGECVRWWIDLEPGRVEPWEHQADLYARSFNTDLCVASYRRILELDPDHLKARLALAGLLTEGRNPDEALTHFEYVRQRRGDTTDVLLGLAHCRRALAQFDEARRLLEAVLAREPDHWAALAERGWLAQAAGSDEEAVTWFRQSLARRPAEKEIAYALYTALVRLGRQREAEEVQGRLKGIEADLEEIKQLTREVVKSPRDAELRYRAGAVLMRNGQEDGALGWFASALREDPEHAATHRALAEYHERKGDAGGAAEHRAKARGPSRPRD